MGVNVEYDLKKVEKNFQEYLKTGLDEKKFRINEIIIDEELLEQQKALYIPFGHISYFLIIEDEKPLLYAYVSSRMDLALIVIVDETGYEVYDDWYTVEGNEDIRKKYFDQSKKVKSFDYDDLIFINDIEK